MRNKIERGEKIPINTHLSLYFHDSFIFLLFKHLFIRFKCTYIFTIMFLFHNIVNFSKRKKKIRKVFMKKENKKFIYTLLLDIENEL